MKGVVHGDIKPHNVLISEDEPGCYTAKVADLGYSVQLLGDNDYGYMPRSVPWQAPEWYERGHLFSEMVKMDIYSFGLVCLWLLFNEKLYENDLVFDALPDKHPHPLESMKQNELKETAERLVFEIVQSSASNTIDLVLFFRSCLTPAPKNRASSMNAFIENLGARSPMITVITPSESSTEDMTSIPLQPFQVSGVEITRV